MPAAVRLALAVALFAVVVPAGPVGGGFANTLRVEDPSDFRDLGLLAYDV